MNKTNWNYFASSDPHHGIQFIPSDILSGISSDILSGISSDILSGILFGILYGFVCGRWGPVEVRRGPQRSDSRRLKSGEDHCYQELADEIWRGSLRSRAGRWGPARKKEEKKEEGGDAPPT